MEATYNGGNLGGIGQQQVGGYGQQQQVGGFGQQGLSQGSQMTSGNVGQSHTGFIATPGHVITTTSQTTSYSAYPIQSPNVPLTTGQTTGYNILSSGTPIIGGGVLPTSQMMAPQQYQQQQQFPTSEQFATEALMRGVDPLSKQQHHQYNVGQSQGGFGNQGLTGSQHKVGQNVTQTPYFSGTDPLLYEGDVNSSNKPPQQVPYGHGHGKGQNLSNQGNINQTGPLDPNRQF